MRTENGFTLIETLIGLGILSIVAVALLSGMAMTGRANIITDEQTNGETLARAQMESVLNQTYDSTNNPPVYSKLSDLPAGYDVVTPMAVRLDPKGDGTSNDDGLQKITVIVKHGTNKIRKLL